MYMKKKTLVKTAPALLLTPLLLSSIDSSAQTGVLKGTIIDSTTNESAYADISLTGPTPIVATPEIDGTFLINELKAGTYQIHISGPGLKDRTLNNIVIKDNDTLDLQVIKVGVEKEEIEATTVTARVSTNNASALINETKLANQVISGVSQEQIKMSQDKNAAQVMSRIPGITIVDGRFVMVRGIPERYNQVLLNNAIAPSTEVDRRTFSFDLIPSNVLDRMLIYKSGAPENTGDFAGGLIKVFTANTISENFTNVSLGVGYRTGTTGNDYIQSGGSKTDGLGFDNGYRQLPDAFPTENLRSLGNRSPQRIAAAHTLNNNFAPKTSTALPDISVGMSLGRRIFLSKKNDKTLSTITAINYGQSYVSYDKEFNRYLELGAGASRADKRFAFSDANYEKENKIGLISNWRLYLNENNNISFKNLFNQVGENTTVIRTGTDFIQQSGLERKNYMYQYRSRSVYSGQLEGNHKHNVGDKIGKINWVLGMNYLYEDQPDLRRFRTIQTNPGAADYRMILPPSSNLYDAGRFYSKLNEVGFNNAFNYILDLKENKHGTIQLKAGYMIDYRSRSFDTRYFSYFYPGSSSFEEQQRLSRLPLDQIFDHQNIKQTNGFSLEEGTRNSDNYEATNLLTAGYLGTVVPLGDLTLSGGLRFEYNIQQLNAKNDANADINVNNKVLSPLAFVNADYDFNATNKLRFAYYRSVNRPEFRELAPFLFYDYQFDAEKYGNPDLKTADIDNVDLRFETYPRKGETISLGAFYKRFTNPIETQILIRSESPAFSYQNAASAYSAGLELELRKSLQGVFNSGFMDKMSVNLNAAVIKSEVDYGNESLRGQDNKRALQGQSPYIINAMVNYNDTKNGFQVNASYNVFGKRIYAVGSSLFPTIYEMPRHVLDLTVSKTISKSWSAKLGISDVMNAKNRFYQDTNRDTKIDMDGVDDVIFNYRRGTNINFSINYKF